MIILFWLSSPSSLRQNCPLSHSLQGGGGGGLMLYLYFVSSHCISSSIRDRIVLVTCNYHHPRPAFCPRAVIIIVA